MTVVPRVGHTGQHDLIAYICLADALDRNREAVILGYRVNPYGGGVVMCNVCVLYHLTLGQHMSPIIINDFCVELDITVAIIELHCLVFFRNLF